MRAYKNTPTPTVLCVEAVGSSAPQDVAVASSDPQDVTVSNTVLNSSNWSGHTAYPSSTNRFIAVQGDWNHPSNLTDTCTASLNSTWVGLGGGANGLIQAGTASHSDYYNLPHRAWYEYISSTGADSGEIRLANINVNAGDAIHSYVSYQTANNQANFYVSDGTTGTSQSILTTLGAAYYDGQRADWIVERPGVNGALAPLRHFNDVNFTNGQAQNQSGNWVGIGGAASHDQWVMYNGTHQLANPTALQTNTTFTDKWVACL